MAELWTKPSSALSAHPLSSTEGYPIPSGTTPALVYAPGQGSTRYARQLLGVQYPDCKYPEDAEGGTFNEARRWMYNFCRGLYRLQTLCEAWGSDFTTNFFTSTTFDASGSGTTVTITWDDGDAWDARNMSGSCLSPGWFVMDEVHGYCGIAQITDVTFTGYSNPTHTAQLTLNKPLDATRDDKLYVLQPKFFPALPVYQQSIDAADLLSTPQCKYCLKAKHHALSSFASVYTSESRAAFIDGQFFCSQMNAGATGFEGENCNNTGCACYSAHSGGGVWSDNDISRLLLAKGVYALQSAAGGSTFNYFTSYWPGLLMLLGFPLQDFTNEFGLWAAYKYYYAYNAITDKKATTDDYGHCDYMGWLDENQYRADNSDDEIDNIGLFEDFCDVVKKDPAGGIGSGAQALVMDEGRTPGMRYEREIGVRRAGYAVPGPSGSVGGAGESSCQRVMQKKYTSYPFTLPQTSGYTVNTNGETKVTFSTLGYIVGATGLQYDLKFEIPRFCEKVTDPRSALPKGVSTTTMTYISLSSHLLTVDFALGSVSAGYMDTSLPSELQTSNFNCGGNIVAPNIAHEIYNPFGPGIVGDRNTKLYPGDVVEFDIAGTSGLRAACVGAEAFGGATQASATSPDSRVQGIPEVTATDIHKKDRAYFYLEGRTGQIIEAYVGGVTGSELTFYGYDAVAPSTKTWNSSTGLATGYVPQLYKVWDDGASTALLTAGTDYLWDPVDGAFYIDSSGWDTDETYYLHFVGYVYDRRALYSVNVPNALNACLESACGGFIDLGVTTSTLVPDLVDVTSPNSYEEDVGFVPNDSLSSPRVSWSMPKGDCDRLALHTHTPAETSVSEEIQSSSESAPYIIGADVFIDPLYPSTSWTYAKLLNTYVLKTFRVPKWWTADEVDQAFVDVIIENGVMYNKTHSWATGETAATNTTSADDDVDIKMTGVFVTESGGVITETASGITISGTLDKHTVSGTDYLSGTLDCTDLIKSVLDDVASNTDTSIALKFVPATATAATDDVEDQLFHWIKKWSMTYDASGTETARDFEWEWLEFDDVVIRNLRIKPKYSEIRDNAPDLHYGYSTIAGVPNLVT